MPRTSNESSHRTTAFGLFNGYGCGDETESSGGAVYFTGFAEVGHVG